MRVLLFCVLGLSVAKAQPVIKASEMNFHTGSTIVYSNTEALFVEAGAGSFQRGANITWNFSDLKPGSNDTMEVLKAEETPFKNYFSKADIAVRSRGVYTYFDKASGGIEELGTSSADNYNLFYSNAALSIPSGLNYGDQVTDTIVSYENIGGLSTDRHGSSTIKYEAYGTLILAEMIYDSVMLISYERNISDQDGNKEYFMEYSWIVKNDPFPVLKYMGRKAGNDFIAYMQVRSGLHEIISVKDEQKNSGTVYYNQEENSLRFNGNGSNESVLVFIVNSNGALVYEGSSENGVIRLPELSKGMYSVSGMKPGLKQLKFLVL